MHGKREKKKAINYILYADYKYAKKQNITLFSVIRQDRNGSSEDRFFFGGSWRGRPFSRHNLTYLNTAVSIQRDDYLQFTQGFGIDGGITKRFRAFWRPSITLAGAFGSKNFRQTGLQDNNGKFNGKTKFKYYGVVLNPELANLLVGTVGFGLIPRERTRTSIDLVYHYYSQISTMDELVDADVREDPEGDSKDIGHELDMVFGTNITKCIKFSIAWGVFFPGTAYDNDDNAYFTEIELQIAFK